jgi:D-glycero-D-manno-heptose 1,7-bisphosphate phosphatase
MKSGLRPVVFLDRDGVLNRCYVKNGTTVPPTSVTELEILPGVPEALSRLGNAGLCLIVVTNQPDVARGTQCRRHVDEINARLKALLPLFDVRTCYHDDADGCGCRKPRPGLLLEAAADFGLDLQQGFMIGDRWSDVAAGRAAGCRTVLIETPYSGCERCRPDRCVADVGAAAEWIVSVIREQ